MRAYFMWHTRIHRAYDDLPNTERFWIMLGLALPGILLSSWPGISWVNGVGFIWLVTMLFSRMAYIHKW